MNTHRKQSSKGAEKITYKAVLKCSTLMVRKWIACYYMSICLPDYQKLEDGLILLILQCEGERET